MFVGTNLFRDKIMFVATNIFFFGDKTFVMTSILLSRQKTCFVAAPANDGGGGEGGEGGEGRGGEGGRGKRGEGVEGCSLALFG